MEKEIANAFLDKSIRYIILIGPGSSGKSYALKNAIHEVFVNDDSLNCLVWDYKEEMPHYYGESVDHSFKKFVLVRVSHDEIVKEFLKCIEQKSTVKIINF
jgi:GTPase SAR1 family protein